MKERGKHLETIIVIACGMIVFYFVFKKDFLLFIALGVGLVGAFIPLLAKWIHVAWMGLAKVLGFISSHVLLGVIFFVMLTPLALVRKLFSKKDQLQLRKQDGSYFAERPSTS